MNDAASLPTVVVAPTPTNDAASPPTVAGCARQFRWRRYFATAAGLATLVVTLTGCAASGPDTGDRVKATRRPDTAGSTAASPVRTGEGTASFGDGGEGTADGSAAGDGARADNSAATPTPVASTSAGLGEASLPRPSALGPAWRYRVAGTQAEEGFAGNGTPATVIAPNEIVQTVLPFGCVQRPELPMPIAALSVEYELPKGPQAVAVRLRFLRAGQARDFVSGWQTAAAACQRQAADPISGAAAPLTQLRRVGQVWVADRHEADDLGNPVIYTEWKALRGTDVLLLAEQQTGWTSAVPAPTATVSQVAAALEAQLRTS